MRPILITALLLTTASCGDNESTSAPASVTPADLSAAAVPPSGDMATAIAPGADMTTAPTFPMTATVIVGPNGTLTFSPQTVDIAAGGTVTWNWAGGPMPHNVTSGDTPPRFPGSPTQTTGTYQNTFATPGSYFYFCSVHGRNVMNGTVIVH